MIARVLLYPEWVADGRPGVRVGEDPAVRMITAGLDPVVPRGAVCLRVAVGAADLRDADGYRARLAGRDLRPGELRYGAEAGGPGDGAVEYGGRWWLAGPEVPAAAVLVLPVGAGVEHADVLAETMASAGWVVARRGRQLWRAGDHAERLDGSPVRVVAAEQRGRVVVAGVGPCDVSVAEIVPPGAAAERAKARRQAGEMSGPPASASRLAELADAVRGLPTALRRPRPDARAVEPEREDLPAEDRLRRMLARGGVR